jgi:glycine/D-amino acid oxidase-like deaminating enzyme/nitrite reductase/ring-hydroxylating ferredoxin subunit
MDAVESTQSIWKSEHPAPRSPLGQNADCDVCIIGAGIAGLSTAYDLSRHGKRVIVLDARDIAAGETAQTTAHLASALDDRFFELARIHGRQGARLAYESHARAIDEIEAAVLREGITCDFARIDGYLFAAPEHDVTLLEKELEAAQRAGFSSATLVPRAPVPSFDTGPCIRFPNQARIHPLKYMSAIADAIERWGGTIHTSTRVTEVRGGSPAVARTRDGFEVRAKAIVVATNSPFHLRVPIHVKQAPYRTYAVALRVERGSVPDALYWDTRDPYHYVRLGGEADGFDTLIVGGEDHRTASSDDADARYARLEQWARKRFPIVGERLHRWSGQVLEPFDSLAFIGKDPAGARNIYIATGDSGHGMTHGVIAGNLLADLISGKENPWQTLYDPARKSIRASGEYVRGGLEVAKDYAEWLMPEPRRRNQPLDRGEGVVVQRGAHKIAIYKDEQGAIHECSAVCTHLGGVVHWNSDAKSWDCGCHGSRFAPTGEVLNGPASRDLERVDRRSQEQRARFGSIVLGALGGTLLTLAISTLVTRALE